MTYTLTISSQGQVVIPSAARKALGLKPGTKLSLSIEQDRNNPRAVMQPLPESWVAFATGLGKGIWGKGEEYIESQRKSW